MAGTLALFAISPVLYLLETDAIMPWPRVFFFMSWILLLLSIFMAVTAFLSKRLVASDERLATRH